MGWLVAGEWITTGQNEQPSLSFPEFFLTLVTKPAQAIQMLNIAQVHAFIVSPTGALVTAILG